MPWGCIPLLEFLEFHATVFLRVPHPLLLFPNTHPCVIVPLSLSPPHFLTQLTIPDSVLELPLFFLLSKLVGQQCFIDRWCFHILHKRFSLQRSLFHPLWMYLSSHVLLIVVHVVSISLISLVFFNFELTCIDFLYTSCRNTRGNFNWKI